MIYLYLGIFISGTITLWNLYRASKESQEENPILAYWERSQPNSEAWRWRRPDDSLALPLDDQPQSSTISIEPRLNFSHYILSIVGYGAIALGTYAAIAALLRDGTEAIGIAAFACFITGLFGLALLSYHTQVIRLIRTPSTLTIVELWGLFLKRSISVRRGANVSARGKIQNVLLADTSQEMLTYEILLKKHFLFLSSTKRLQLYGNQSQGSWLVDGINQWIREEEYQEGQGDSVSATAEPPLS